MSTFWRVPGSQRGSVGSGCTCPGRRPACLLPPQSTRPPSQAAQNRRLPFGDPTAASFIQLLGGDIYLGLGQELAGLHPGAWLLDQHCHPVTNVLQQLLHCGDALLVENKFDKYIEHLAASGMI